MRDAAKHTAARARWRAKHRAQIRDSQNEKNSRWRARRKQRGPDPESLADRLSVVGASELRAPRFWWIDRDGRIHPELWESPEQLLARLQKEHRC